MLQKKQFNILSVVEGSETKLSQRQLANKAHLSIGTVNKIVTELTQEGLIEDGSITKKGLKELEPYRVKRAVFLAAGFGSRLVPITLNTPKPLVRVKGKRIIDSLLDAVIKVGIKEIYVVRGYLSEQFDQLLYQYPMIQFIENPEYNESNNISSVYYARKCLENAYVFEADLLLYNPELITKYQYSSNYLGSPVKETDDWCFTMKNNKIASLQIGGRNCYHEFGISYWTKEEGKQLGKDVVEVFKSPGGRERFWDQVIFDYYPKHYEVSVRECTFDDITEIDTYRELVLLDETYRVK